MTRSTTIDVELDRALVFELAAATEGLLALLLDPRWPEDARVAFVEDIAGEGLRLRAGHVKDVGTELQVVLSDRTYRLRQLLASPLVN